MRSRAHALAPCSLDSITIGAQAAPPLLFETMTFSDSFGEIQLRCSTYLQAEEMHQTVVSLVRDSLDQANETAQDAIRRLKAMAL